MKASDSTNSLTGLTESVNLEINTQNCFICLEDMNEIGEPLVDSTLLRTCGCRFKVHPACWNEWMKDKTEFDCPICRSKSRGSGKSPVPIPPAQEWPNERKPFWKKPVFLLFCVFIGVGSSIMIYEIFHS